MSLKDRYSKILKKAKVFVILAEKDIMFLPTGPFDRGEHWYTLGEGSLFDFPFKELEKENQKVIKERQKQNSFDNISVHEALIRTLYHLAKKEDEEKRDAFITEYLKKFVQEHEVESYYENEVI